jgi:drug/metabolite transporter (DMT)-like permease
MTQAIIYAIGAMLFYGLADLVYKRAAVAGVKAHHFMMLQAFFFAPTVIIYGLVTGMLEYRPAALWGSAAGILLFVGLYQFARSLRTGSVSINAPIFRLNFTITAALAVVLLHEPITATKIAGLALALLAIWLLLGASGKVEHVSRASIAQVLVATVAMSLANLVYKFGMNGGATAATMMVAQAALFFPLSTGFACLLDRGFKPPRSAWPYPAAAAWFLALALVLLLESLKRGQASVLVPISQMGFVVTAAVGILFLREPLTRRKALGLVIAVAALACLAWS